MLCLTIAFRCNMFGRRLKAYLFRDWWTRLRTCLLTLLGFSSLKYHNFSSKYSVFNWSFQICFQVGFRCKMPENAAVILQPLHNTSCWNRGLFWATLYAMSRVSGASLAAFINHATVHRCAVLTQLPPSSPPSWAEGAVNKQAKLGADRRRKKDGRHSVDVRFKKNVALCARKCQCRQLTHRWYYTLCVGAAQRRTRALQLRSR